MTLVSSLSTFGHISGGPVDLRMSSSFPCLARQSQLPLSSAHLLCPPYSAGGLWECALATEGITCAVAKPSSCCAPLQLASKSLRTHFTRRFLPAPCASPSLRALVTIP